MNRRRAAGILGQLLLSCIATSTYGERMRAARPSPVPPPDDVDCPGQGCPARDGTPSRAEIIDALKLPKARRIKPKAVMLWFLFRFNGDTISDMLPDSLITLDETIPALKLLFLDREITAITLVGHADAIGSAAYNLTLSERRAEAVKYYLVKNGIDSSLVTTTGKGASEPLAKCPRSSKRIECLGVNRRVEIVTLRSHN
jgi:outer membrane protein OmpA-like peptidoglycan-associated protein